MAYFLIGYGVAYGINFFASAATIQGGEGSSFDGQGLSLVKFFFLLTFAAAIPAIISAALPSALNLDHNWQRRR